MNSEYCWCGEEAIVRVGDYDLLLCLTHFNHYLHDIGEDPSDTSWGSVAYFGALVLLGVIVGLAIWYGR